MELGNYLRVRGEYIVPHLSTTISWELPPRTRRIPHALLQACVNTGTTSAYAENTAWWTQTTHSIRNYLRVRGEYPYLPLSCHKIRELPPRTRRIQRFVPAVLICTGTTSAYAENTRYQQQQQPQMRNYLRVRGEYITGASPRSKLMELPPRTRRILHENIVCCGRNGTTSAYAENTCPDENLIIPDRNYLRVRGEYLPPLGRQKSR